MNTRIIAVVITFFTVSACNKGPNFSQLCKDHPEICAEFSEDSWCKKERIAVGAANLENKLAPNEDITLFNQLIAYEKYEKCISHAAKIEHIKLKEKKTRRIDNMMKARARLEELSELSKNSNHPRLLYYHWTRHLDEGALNRFLALEGTKELETSESQFELATYYIKVDPDKTLQLLFHSLELSKEGDIVNLDIFKSLSSIFSKKRQQQQAYIWLKVLSLYEPEDPALSPNTLTNFKATHKLDYEFLDKVADATVEKINTGNFKPPKF